jgi:hypothetical protein
MGMIPSPVGLGTGRVGLYLVGIEQEEEEEEEEDGGGRIIAS